MIYSIRCSIIVLWFATIDLFLFKAVRNCRKRTVVTNVYQKGFDKTKAVYKYLCQLIFIEPTNDFMDSNNQKITIELIHVNDKSVKTKLSTLILDFKDVEISRDICCNKSIFGYFEIIRHKPLPPINFIRGVHNSPKDSRISFKGFEIIDLMSGQRSYFGVNTVLVNEDLKEAVVHNIKPQRIHFFKKQTFCPDFHSVESEEYGKQMPTPDKCSEEVNGIYLLPTLNWFEVFVFNAFLIHLSFALLTAVISYYNESTDFKKSFVAVLSSGLIAATVTQIVSYSYRSIVKTNYELNCSQIKVELKQSSTFWLTFRWFYLIVFLLASVFFSILNIFLITDELAFDFEDNKEDIFSQTENLLILFCFTLIVVYIIWLPIFVVLRFLFRLMLFTPKGIIEEEEEIEMSNKQIRIEKLVPQPVLKEKSNKKEISNKSNEKSERSVLGEGSRVSSSQKTPSKSNRSREETRTPRELSGKPDKLTKEKSEKVDKSDKSPKEDKDKDEPKRYSQLGKDDELNTGSIIVKPTKSVAFYDPDMFRLTESTIGDEPKAKSLSSEKKKTI